MPLSLACTLAHAQSSTAGAIAGTVTDASGALLPNVSITITSDDTGAARTVKTNGSGEYRVDLLQPGIYTLHFTDDGFEGEDDKNVTVTVGVIANVSPKLKTGSVSTQVEVSDESPIMHTQDNAISTVIDRSLIDNLPINGRRWSDFARLTPGVVSTSQGFGLLSFRGVSNLLNNNTIDGADDNQAFYSEARGRTRTAFTVPPSAIREFQVNTSNYSAQYGRAAGGVVNTVTVSGSNSMHGQVFFYDRDNGLGGATNPYTLLTVQNADGTYGQVPTKPKDWRKDWGFTLSGPIIRDKLFFAYTYDQERRNYPGISRPTDPNDFFAPSNATLPSGETCSTTAFTTTALSYLAEGDYNSCLIAALYGVPFQAGSSYYKQGLGILQSETGQVDRRQDQVINMPKLDWQINDRNHLSLLYNRMRYSSPSGLYSQSTVVQAPSGWGNDNVKEDFGIAHLTTVINSNILNDALVQYGRDFEFDYQKAPSPNELPFANNQYGRMPGTGIGFYFGTYYVGANPDLSRIADPDERRLQLLDGVTWSIGKHTAKFGLEYNKVSDYDNQVYNGNGSYSYDWTYNFIADYLHTTTGIGGANYQPTYYDYSQGLGNPTISLATREYAGYATDDWRILPNLTLTLGVRYEYQYVPPNPMANLTGNPALSTVLGGLNTALPQSANRPDDRNNIGPRVGFAWNMYGTGKTVLRGGYGMYYGRIINSNIMGTYQDSGSPNGQLSFTPLYNGGCAPTFPNIYKTISDLPASGCSAPSVAYFSNHMQNPQVHEADLALEQDLGHNTTLSVTYMMSLGRELPTAIDKNINYAATGFGSYSLAAPTGSSSSLLASYPVSTTGEAVTSLSQYPLPPQTGYIVQPHGGKASPAYPAGYQAKFFLSGARLNPAFYQILQVQSSVNSSYNALAFQVNHRYEHGLSLLTNFTWAHSLDEQQYQGTFAPSFTLSDPTNPRADYGNSDNDVRLRYVGTLVYEPQVYFNGWKRQVLGGWRIAPLVSLQSGFPYSPTISASSFKNVTLSNGSTGSITAGINGSGSSNSRVPWIGRNSYTYPKTAVFDVRVGKNFYLPAVHYKVVNSEPRLEFFAELFNVMNHQNITGLNTPAYQLGDVSANKPVQTLTPLSTFATYTNSNSNYTYSPRQLQLALRLHF